jgi:hypothetical protein
VLDESVLELLDGVCEHQRRRVGIRERPLSPSRSVEDIADPSANDHESHTPPEGRSKRRN